MAGTAISVLSISLLAMEGGAFNPTIAIAITQALCSALLMNIAIVGINQLYDVEIDKVNKPYLPLASGELSQSQGTAIVAACAAAGLYIGWVSGSVPLLWTLGVSLLLGIVYSTDLPLMRWKRSPVLAAACILIVRALIVQMGFFFHAKQALAASSSTASMTAALAASSSPAAAGAAAAAAHAAWSPALLTAPATFTVAFMLLFSVVIALFKDIPDTLGDQRAGVRTLSVRVGVERVFWICIWTLSAAYAGAAAFCIAHCASLPVGAALAAAHGCMCALLWRSARDVNLTKVDDLTAFYMLIWKLFYAEYLLVPFLV